MTRGRSCLFFAGILMMATCSWARDHHYSSWSDDPRPYLAAIEKAGSIAPGRPSPGLNLRAGIITHHFLASSLMVRFFENLHQYPQLQTIVLIGPNHFHHGRANVSVSSVSWKTPFGIVETNQAMVRQITAATNLPEDTEAFTGEHSVGVLMPFVKYYLPHCRVVPILIDVNAHAETMNSLRILLQRFLNDPAVFVVMSMDFSHDSTAAVAYSRDQQAERAISGLDADAVDGLHVDCHKGLHALLSSLRDVGATRVRIDEHTNSSRILGNPLQRNVTSYFSIFFGSANGGKPAT